MSALMLFLEAGATRFALPASAVAEVVPAVPLHPAPGYAGVLRYRGAVVPVLALGALGESRLGGRIVIVESAGPPRVRVGLLADRVCELKPLDPTGPPLALPTDATGPDLGPLVAQAGGVVRLLDPARLLASLAVPA